MKKVDGLNTGAFMEVAERINRRPYAMFDQTKNMVFPSYENQIDVPSCFHTWVLSTRYRNTANYYSSYNQVQYGIQVVADILGIDYDFSSVLFESTWPSFLWARKEWPCDIDFVRSPNVNREVPTRQNVIDFCYQAYHHGFCTRDVKRNKKRNWIHVNRPETPHEALAYDGV